MKLLRKEIFKQEIKEVIDKNSQELHALAEDVQTQHLIRAAEILGCISKNKIECLEYIKSWRDQKIKEAKALYPSKNI